MSRVSVTPNFRATPDRNFRGDKRNIFRGPNTRPLAFELTTHEWNNISAEAINSHMHSEGLSLKELAEKIGCSDRTVENYTQAKTAPAGLHFLRCIAAIPEFEAEVRRVAGLLEDSDPVAMHAALDLVRAAQKFMDVRAPREMPSLQVIDGGAEEAATGDLFEGESDEPDT